MFSSSDVVSYFVQGEKTWGWSSGLKNLITPQAFERLLDGHATNEHHE